jgi:hypothetical protein
MGQSCLYRFNQGISVGCTIPQVGVKDIYLMHADEVKLTLDVGGNVTAVAFAEGKESYKIEGYKQNIQLTASVFSTDVSVKLAASIIFKMPSVNTFLMKTILSGRYYVLVVRNSGTAILVGVQAPLECSGFDYDSNGGAGFATVTLSAPEGSGGNYLSGITEPAITSITSKAV